MLPTFAPALAPLYYLDIAHNQVVVPAPVVTAWTVALATRTENTAEVRSGIDTFQQLYPSD